MNPQKFKFPEVFQAKYFSDSICFLSLPNLGSSHIVSVLSRFTRSPAQTEKQSNIFKDCSREFLSSLNNNAESSAH